MIKAEVENINVHPSQMGKNAIRTSENFIIYIPHTTGREYRRE